MKPGGLAPARPGRAGLVPLVSGNAIEVMVIPLAGRFYGFAYEIKRPLKGSPKGARKGRKGRRKS